MPNRSSVSRLLPGFPVPKPVTPIITAENVKVNMYRKIAKIYIFMAKSGILFIYKYRKGSLV